MIRSFYLILAGLILLSACYGAPELTTPSPAPTLTVSPTLVLPTPLASPASITYADLQVAVDRAEFSDAYTTEFQTSRTPPAGKKFLWVHILLKNVGPKTLKTPVQDHYSILFFQTEFKPTYGHRKDYQDYTSLDSTLPPGQTINGWLRFEILNSAELSQIRAAYIPEGVHIPSVSGSGSDSWADRPFFLWSFLAN